MKKVFLLLACACLVFTSCDDFMQLLEDMKTEQESNPNEDNENEDGTDDGKEEENNKEDVELTPDSQKTKLESVGMKLMGMYPAEDFAELNELSRFCEDKYLADEYDWDAFFNRYEEIYEVSVKENETPKGWDYEVVLLLSQCTGTFTLGNTTVLYSDTPADKTVFKFKDMNGKDCSATLTQVGKIQKVYLGHFWENDHHYEGYYDDVTGEWVHNEYVETYNYDVTIGVPEQIKVDMIIGSGKYVEMTFDYEFDISSTGADITTDNATATISIKVADTEAVIEKAHFDAATGKMEFSCKLTKGGQHLASISGSANGKFKVVTEEENDATYQWIESESFGSLSFEADVLGEIQVTGVCPDVVLLFDEYHSDSDWEMGVDNSAEWARVVDRMNEGFEFCVYYDKMSTKQATLEFEPETHHEEGEYWSYYWYDVIPVICFNDGSKYSVEDYFTEDAFALLVESAEDFAQAYEDMFERSIEEEN